MKPCTLLSLMAICEKNIVRYILLSITLILGLDKDIEMIVISIYVLLFFLHLKSNNFKVKNCLKEMLVLLFFVVSILGTLVIYPENAQYILDDNNFWNTIFPCVRYFFIGLIFIPDKYTMNLMGKASCWAILIEIAFVILYMMPRGLLSNDDMSRAYQILPNVLFVINYALNEKTKSGIFSSFLGIFYILGMGTRGPLIVICSYIFIKILKNISTKMKILVGSFLAAFVTIGNFIIIDVLKIIRNIFSSFNLSTRIIDLFLADSVISHMSGRDEIYDIAIKKIIENPWFGYGIYGEWQWFNWSVHNMYLEVILHYGLIIGLFILISVLALVICTYTKTKNTFAKDFILIWGSFVFVRGLFGGAYLHFSLFILIAFCMRECYRVKVESRELFECNKNILDGKEL